MSGMVTWRAGEGIARLTETLAGGGVLVVPTESSYALAVDPRSAAAVERVFALKGRPPGKPLGVVAADRTQIEALGGRLDDPVLERLASLWPAPLSLLVPLEASLPAAAGERRLAVRVPAHDTLRRLLSRLGTALTATSANPSGEPPLSDPRAVARWLADEPGIVLVDGGRLAGGQPSTLVGVREGRLEVVRRGAISAETLERVAGGGDGGGFSAASVEIFADESR